ncbi:MAG TPA: cytochrome c biogenesis protein CcsA [Polyangiaceae bacterium]
MRSNTDKIFWALLGLTAVSFFILIAFVFLRAPIAQPQAGGLAQKIFYFHVPAAYALYVCGTVGFIAGAMYLYKPTDARDAWSRAGVECAVIFGLMVLTSGPLWAKKAWGVYWTWDPRLTTLMLNVLLYVSVVVLRAFAGSGDAERRFAAALTVLGTLLLPVIHYAVKLWGGIHPTVVTQGGGGLQHPDMKTALSLGFVAMTFLAVVLLWSRARLALALGRMQVVEEVAAARGIGAAS